MGELEEKSYLIRRNLQQFLGPKSLSSIATGFRSMQVTGDDEIAGSCGPWVFLSNRDEMRMVYPDVAAALGFGTLDFPGKIHSESLIYVESDTKSGRDRKKSRSRYWLWILMVLFLAAAAGAGLYAFRQRLPVVELNLPTIEKVSALAADPQKFDEAMERVVRNVDYVVRDLDHWLPYLRRYAFSRDGNIKGLDHSILLGISPGLPEDCSLKAWKKGFGGKNKELGEFLAKGRLVRAASFRILAWDPHWILRRPNSGWPTLTGPYGACVDIALRALGELSSGKSGEEKEFAAAYRRLQYLSQALKSQRPLDEGSVDLSSGSVLEFWTCSDRAKNWSSLEDCRAQFTEHGGDLNNAKVVSPHFGWNLIRLVMESPKDIPDSIQQQFNSWGTQLDRGKIDFASNLDYRAEARFFGLYLQGERDVSKILGKVKAEYPNVVFSNNTASKNEDKSVTP